MVADSKESLGAFLRSEREKRGITIEQVASATKVSVRMLHSLEADQYADLPAKPFVRGFVISYAQFVGLDSKDVLTQFSKFIEDKSGDREGRPAAPSGYAFEKRDTDRSRTILWVSMVSFLVIGATVFFVVKPMLKKRRLTQVEQLRVAEQKKKEAAKAAPKVTETAEKDKDAVAAKDGKPEASKAEEKKTAENPETKPEEKEKKVAKSMEPGRVPSKEDPLNKGDRLEAQKILQKIVFRSLERIWVRYQVDKRPVMQFVLDKNKLLVLRAEESIKFQTSNPERVQYRYASNQYRPLEGSNLWRQKNSGHAVVLPEELSKTLANPFPNRNPLPKLSFVQAPPAPTPATTSVSSSDPVPTPSAPRPRE